eukprot:3240014-Pleurochrysis_carterae.AAC.1
MEALEHLRNAPPSLPPSPPPMHLDETPEGPGGDGPSQPPEGHELEDRDEADLRSESGRTEATDGDLVNAARYFYGVAATQMQPYIPITEFTTELGWR